MRIILIENTVYKVTEKQFNAIWEKQDQVLGTNYHPENEILLSNYLESEKSISGRWVLLNLIFAFNSTFDVFEFGIS
jgi:hypothetical protein